VIAPTGTLEVTLTHRRGRWRATGDGVDVAHADLAELDALITAAIPQGAARRVHVRFDASRLPAWTRQYQSHYFNYVLIVDRGSEA
jgi:hypothetical protein